MGKYLFTMLSIFLFSPLSLKAQSDVVVINEENFPDNAFRTKIGSATYDRDGNGVLDAAEIARIHQLDLSGSWPNYIADLTGIAFFPDVDSLSVRGNHLSTIDLSHNTKIRKLYVDNNQLTTIDLSPLTSLVEFSAADNKLTTFKAVPKLKSLMLDRNAMTSLDLTGNNVLDSLSCRANKLTSLDLKALPDLRYLICNNNALTSLDVSGNPKLLLLYCFNMKLQGLDLSNNKALDELNCNSCGLDCLDVTSCPELRLLTCSFNNLKSIDVSKNPKLQKLLVGVNTGIKSVDVTHNLLLQNLDLYQNPISEIDLSNNPELTSFGARDTGLKRIDLSANTKLSQLTLGGDSLVALNLSGLSKISYTNTYMNSKYLSHKRTVTLKDNVLDLSLLAADGLDPARISSVNGGVLNGNSLTFTSKTVTYVYDTQAETSNYKKFYVELDASNYSATTGIDKIIHDKAADSRAVERYNLSGQKVSAAQKGIHIVRNSDGTMRKIIIK